MKFINILPNLTSTIVNTALTQALKDRVVTDNNSVGGAAFERELSKLITTDVLPAGYICVTNKDIEEILPAGGYDVDVTNFAPTWSQLKSDMKKASHPLSAADIYLMEKVSETTFKLTDGVSMKTSITDKDGGFIFLHNDAEGEVYDSIVNDTELSLGQVLLVTFNTEKGVGTCYYFNQSVGDIIEMFEGEGVMDNERVVYSTTRQVVKVINRNAITKKKQTSFNRGLQIEKRFLDVMVRSGVMTRLTGVSVNVNTIRRDIFNERFGNI